MADRAPVKPSRRARLTTNPMAVRANGNSIRGRRLRDLYAAFAAKIDSKKIAVAAGVKNADFKTASYVGLGRLAPADYYDGEDD